MSVSPTVWAQIRAGRPPTLGLVAEVLDGESVVLGETGALRARSELAARVLGAGPLEPLLADPEVTDVLVNADSGVWVDRGDGLTRTDCEVGDAEAVRRLAVRLAGIAGRRLDDTSPYVDGLLPGGVRLHAVLPPIAVEGSHISLRVPRRVAPSLAGLAGWGMFSPGWLAVLRALVSRRCSFVVSGGTGSGKTTLLGALLGEVDVRERLVIVEDVRELAIVHPHVVRLQSRPANVEGRGEVGLTSLVRQSLRMRPDRLVVGEVRGAEVREMLAALNTGHEGGCATLHANAAADVPARLEALASLAGMTREAVAAQAASAFDAVLHLRRDGPRRYLAEIAVVRRGPAGALVVEMAVAVAAGGLPVRGTGWSVLAERIGLGAA